MFDRAREGTRDANKWEGRDSAKPALSPPPTSPQSARLSLISNGRYVTGLSTCTHNMILETLQHSSRSNERESPVHENG